MALLAMLALTAAWYALARVTDWDWAYAVAFLHVGIVCMGADSML